MKASIKTAYVAVAIVMAAAISPTLHAEGSHDSKTPMMNHGGMTGTDGMTSMMGGRGGMMSSCPMMQRSNMPDARSQRPNDQCRERPSVTPRRDG